jgi:hypothetical protein
MSAKVIRVGSRDLGRNTLLSDGFALGTLPGGGYGIRWRKGSAGHADTEYWFPWEPGGLGATTYWFPWEPPQDPVRIEFEGRGFVFCRDTASDAEVARARLVDYEHLQEGR